MARAATLPSPCSTAFAANILANPGSNVDAPPRGRFSPPTGMGLWALAALAESITVGIVRHVSDDLPPLQIAFMRMPCGVVILTPWFINLGLRTVARITATIYRSCAGRWRSSIPDGRRRREGRASSSGHR